MEKEMNCTRYYLTRHISDTFCKSLWHMFKLSLVIILFKTLLCKPLQHIPKQSLVTFQFKTFPFMTLLCKPLLHISKLALMSLMHISKLSLMTFHSKTFIQDITLQEFIKHLQTVTDNFSIQGFLFRNLLYKTFTAHF